MMLRLLYVSIVICLFSACKHGNKGKEKTAENQQQGVFAINTAFTDAEKYVSFPVWFTDSVISKQGIKKITRKFYYISALDMSNTMEEKELREMKEYWFDTQGALNKMIFTYYYDGEKIGRVSFTYSGPKNEIGYSTVTVSEDIDKTEQAMDEEVSSNYYIHSYSKSSKKFQAFREVESGDYLYLIKNKNYWGPLTVDSLLNPTPYDVIMFGNALSPVKRYRVSNKVKEKDVVEWKYIDETQQIDFVKRNEYPFDYKRSFIWNKKGFCKGFIDSTFTSGTYITRDCSDFVLDNKNRPTHIVHRKENQDKKLEEIAIEIITYEL